MKFTVAVNSTKGEGLFVRGRLLRIASLPTRKKSALFVHGFFLLRYRQIKVGRYMRANYRTEVAVESRVEMFIALYLLCSLLVFGATPAESQNCTAALGGVRLLTQGFIGF